MQRSAIIAASLLTIMLTACGSSEPPEVVEQIVVREPGEVVTAPASEAGEAGQAGGAQVDLVAMGEDAFQMCGACHTIEEGAPSSAGPNLYGVIGRLAGSTDGYPYSEALAASDITWDEASLDGFLADPGGFLPGTDMLAGSVRDEERRTAIIAYLASQSASASE